MLRHSYGININVKPLTISPNVNKVLDILLAFVVSPEPYTLLIKIPPPQSRAPPIV